MENDDDVERLVKNAEWVDDKRSREDEKKRLRPGLVIAVFTTIIGGLGTIAVTLILKHI